MEINSQTICDCCEHQMVAEFTPLAFWHSEVPAKSKICVLGGRQYLIERCTHFVPRQGQPVGKGPDAEGFRNGAPNDGANSKGA